MKASNRLRFSIKRFRNWLGKEAANKWQVAANGPAAGLQFLLPDRSRGWGARIVSGIYEPDVVGELVGLAKQGGVLYDAGAHIGFMSCAWLASGPGTVEAFEPLESNARIIQETFLRNGFEKRARLNRFAVGEGDGELLFRFDDSTLGSSSRGHIHGAPAPDDSFESPCETVVKVRSLDSWMAEFKPDPPSVMKIDVEGAEVALLRGARDAIVRHRPWLICEIHSVAAGIELMELMMPLGYRRTRLDKGGACPTIVLSPGNV